jgi:ferredoxin
MAKQNINRREFIKLSAVGVAVFAGTRAVIGTQASSNTPKGKHQWAMVIDQSKCTGCNYCTLACQAHNDVNPEIEWNKVDQDGTVGDQQVFVPRPCMHCEKAPCVEVYRLPLLPDRLPVRCPFLQLGKIHWCESFRT